MQLDTSKLSCLKCFRAGLFIKQKKKSGRSRFFLALYCMQSLWHPMHKDRYAYKSRDNMQRITEELAKLFGFHMYRHTTGHDFSTMNLYLKILCTILNTNSNQTLPLLSNRGGIGIFRFNASKFSSEKQSIKQGWSAIFWVGRQCCSETGDKLLCVWFLQILLHRNCKSWVLRKTCKG